jgi:hypothetical protein
MFGKKTNPNSLALPPVAEANPNAVEILRVWAAPGSPQQLTLRTTWKDSAAWGLLLVDVARHAAKAYAQEGQDPTVVLARIRQMFDAEWSAPTDTPKDISGR